MLKRKNKFRLYYVIAYICAIKVINNNQKLIKMQVSNQTIKVTANQSARTFTIRTYVSGKFSAKYRTIKLSKEEFNSNEYNTENDWKQFLKSDDYYVVR